MIIHHTPVERLEGPVTESVRLAALHRLAHGQWTAARMEKLCVAWEAGVSCEEIALLLGITKNAIVGKVHRLAKRGLLTTRPSPIIRTGPREDAPRPAPAPRPMNAPAPLVTLPPLLSGLPPGLSTERIWDGPPGFNFASRRPPLARWVADDGSWPTGPAQRPCQFVTREGSVVTPWIHCGVPVARGAWCSFHYPTVYARHGHGISV